jgi:hypothetical protein
MRRLAAFEALRAAMREDSEMCVIVLPLRGSL